MQRCFSCAWSYNELQQLCQNDSLNIAAGFSWPMHSLSVLFVMFCLFSPPSLSLFGRSSQKAIKIGFKLMSFARINVAHFWIPKAFIGIFYLHNVLIKLYGGECKYTQEQLLLFFPDRNVIAFKNVNIKKTD